MQYVLKIPRSNAVISCQTYCLVCFHFVLEQFFQLIIRLWQNFLEVIFYRYGLKIISRRAPGHTANRLKQTCWPPHGPQIDEHVLWKPPTSPFIHWASNWWTCFALESCHGTQISIYVHGVHDLPNEFQRGPNNIVLAPRWVLFRIAEAPYQKRSTSKKVVVLSGGPCLCVGGLSKKGKCILSATSVQMTSNHILLNHRRCTFGFFPTKTKGE